MITFTKQEKEHIFAQIEKNFIDYNQLMYFYGRLGNQEKVNAYEKAKEEYRPFYKKVQSWVNEDESTSTYFFKK